MRLVAYGGSDGLNKLVVKMGYNAGPPIPTDDQQEARTAMKRTWTILGVADVASSFRWYQSLFGQTETSPVHDYFGQVLDTDGTVLVCLHQWGEHEHPTLTSASLATPGNGLLLFFRVDDYPAVLKRARTLVDQLEEEPHVNPHTGTPEFSLRDPDGYYVTISSLSSHD